MRRSRFSVEQVIGILKEQEAGAATADVCRRHGISSATFYAWKAKFGGMGVSDAKRLKALACSPETSPGLGFESGYFQALGWRHGHGTERQVDRGDHRGTPRG